MAKRAISSADSFHGTDEDAADPGRTSSKRRRISESFTSGSTLRTQVGRFFRNLGLWNGMAGNSTRSVSSSQTSASPSSGPSGPSRTSNIYPPLPAPYGPPTPSGSGPPQPANGRPLVDFSKDLENGDSQSRSGSAGDEEQEGTKEDPIDLADDSSDGGSESDASGGGAEASSGPTAGDHGDQEDRQSAGPSRLGWTGHPKIGASGSQMRFPSLGRKPRARPTLSAEDRPARHYAWFNDQEETPQSTSGQERDVRDSKLGRRKQHANTSRKRGGTRVRRGLQQITEMGRQLFKQQRAGRLKEEIYRKGPTEGEASKQTFRELLRITDRPSVDTIVKPPRQQIHDVATVKKTTERARQQIAESKSEELEALLARIELERKTKDQAALARLRPSVPSKLKDEEAQVVDEAFQDRNFRRVSASAEVNPGSLKRLRPNVWLDDEIVNFYGGLLLQRAKEDSAGKLPKIHFFNSFFYPKMEQGYSKQLSRWTKKVKVFELDILLMPINLGNAHWTAAAFNIKEKRLEYYDSMGDYSNKSTQIFKVMRSWLEAEHQDKLSRPLDMSDWTMTYSDDTPQQDNGNDCGIFSCQTLEALARGKDLAQGEWEFTAQNMPFFRRMMVYEIAKGEMYKRW